MTSLVKILSFAFAVAYPANAAPLAPTRLLVEDRVTPIGVGDPTPEFSWLPRYREPAAIQSAYHLLVASSREKLNEEVGDRWDSGIVHDSTSAFVTYGGRPLESRAVGYWKVRTADQDQTFGPWSEPARFEMGLLSNQDWQANWIWRPDSPQGHDYVYFRKSFSLSKVPLVRARVYVSSVHHHALYVNGHLVGKGPSFAYPEYQYYQTFDITPYLAPGDNNVLALRVHWFNWGQGRPASQRGLIVQAEMNSADGTRKVFVSDRTWKTRLAEWLFDRQVNFSENS